MAWVRIAKLKRNADFTDKFQGYSVLEPKEGISRTPLWQL